MGPGDARIIVTGIASRGCVQCAVTGFSIRDYYVYVPVDCTAQREEKEKLQAFSLFASFGYRYNVTVTRSDLIQFIESRRSAYDSKSTIQPG
jgi:nicotinamidase-related amidase